MDKIRGWYGAARDYLRDVRGELKRVIWPDRQQTIKLTSVVLIASALVGAIIWLFDSLVGILMGQLLG